MSRTDGAMGRSAGGTDRDAKSQVVDTESCVR